MEFWRMKEEGEMRYRVQQKRHAALERARAQERLMKVTKHERREGGKMITIINNEFKTQC